VTTTAIWARASCERSSDVRLRRDHELVAPREAPTHAKVIPDPGLYRHFKGGRYELLSVARHSETKELLVVYRSVEDRETIWVRPLEMFTELVEHADTKLPRFEPVSGSPKMSSRVDRIAGPLLGVFRRFGGSGRSTGRPVRTRTRLS
jgi:hypothetical protein